MKNKYKEIINGDRDSLLLGKNTIPDNAILLSGSFNPFHFGHKELIDAAVNMTNRKGILELSVINTDKSALSLYDLEKRLEKIPKNYPLLLTRYSKFIEKVESYKKVWFVLGFDTARRLLDFSYYNNIHSVFKKFLDYETRFIVGGRLTEKKFLTLGDLVIPSEFKSLFISIPEEIFREDISSTQLRENSQTN